jgi:hypothetical protein
MEKQVPIWGNRRFDYHAAGRIGCRLRISEKPNRNGKTRSGKNEVIARHQGENAGEAKVRVGFVSHIRTSMAKYQCVGIHYDVSRTRNARS